MDFPIQSNDVICIPGSNIKAIGYGLLAVIPGVVTTLPSEKVRRAR